MVGVAAARDRGCRQPGDMPPARCPGEVLLTGDGGRQWRAALRTADPVVAVAASAGTFWAVESHLGVAPKLGGRPGDVVFASRDGGRSWSTEATINAPTADLLQQVQLVSAPDGHLLLSVFDLDSVRHARLQPR